jgi:predicted enzyme related to lactoylglutathione lyase
MGATKEATMDFNGILIGSEDPKRLVDYYRKLFGDPTYEDESYTTWQLGSGSVSVGPHSEVKGRSAHPGRIIWNIESTDVRGDFERFKSAGAMVIAEPYGFEGLPPDILIATFADPDDNYFQLVSPMDDAATGG